MGHDPHLIFLGTKGNWFSVGVNCWKHSARHEIQIVFDFKWGLFFSSANEWFYNVVKKFCLGSDEVGDDGYHPFEWTRNKRNRNCRIYSLFYDSLRFFIYNVHNICSQALTGAIRVHLISIIKKKKLIAGSTKQK